MGGARKLKTEKVIVGKVLKTLDRLASVPPRSALADAEEYVCAVCDLSIQPCKSHPTAVCKTKLHEGTELNNLIVRKKQSVIRCMACDRPISASSLKKNPTTELCARCAPKTMKIAKYKKSHQHK